MAYTDKTVKSDVGELPPIKKVKTDFNNIKLSKAQFIEKRNKEKELEKRLAAEKKRIEAEIEAEEAAKQKELEELGAEDAANEESQEPVDEVETVKGKGKSGKGKGKVAAPAAAAEETV